MRVFRFLLMLAVMVTALSGVSKAEPKSWVWGWWPSHWKNLDFQPYLDGEKFIQRGLWDRDTWTPQAWIKDAGDAKRIMRDLYSVDIIRDQYTDDHNIPVLVVGPTFMRLSGLDRRRVLKFVDYVFKITESEENGMFFVFSSENDDDPIGVFDKNGFQQD